MDIVLGAMCPKLSEQIPYLSEHYDRDADAITRLVIRGLLTDGEATKAHKRLLKHIQREVDNVHSSGDSPVHGIVGTF